MSNTTDRHLDVDAGRVWVDGPSGLGGQRVQVLNEDAGALQEVWTELDERLSGPEATEALIESLQGRVGARTLHAIRAQLTPKVTSPLIHLARKGDARVVLTFAGQAQSYFDDLERLYEIPSARHVIQVCGDALIDEVVGGAALEGLHPYGLDLVTWINELAKRSSLEWLLDVVLF
jgi:hypothetical protein